MNHDSAASGSPRDKSSLSFIRHELKTPVNAIIGYSEMLIEETEGSGQAAERLRRDLDLIHSAGLEMLSLVNELKLEPDLEDFGFRDRIGRIEECTGRLLHAIGDGAGDAFAGDIVKIRNANRQLLTLVEEFKKTGTLHMDAHHLGPSADVPVSQAVHEAASAAASSLSAPAVGKIPATILVVDDNAMNRDLLSRQLTKLDHAFEVAANGKQAIEMMRTERFDLVLMDVIMPEMDGIEALREIKGDPGLRHIPVIMVSSLDDMDKIVRCIEIGAEDYLPKPPDPVLLKARLGACLEKKRLSDQAMESQKRLKELNKALDVRNRLIRETFGRYLSDEIVENILETPEGLKLGGEKRGITIMMSDLRGFTSIAERLSPEDVVAMINNYLEIMTGIIMKYNGTIDEFIGDAILALFGAPVQREDDALRAVACAVEMQTAMDTVNRRNREAGYPEVSMGIGINTGSVVVGNIGCSKRVKYGVVGKNVNLTSRIESYTVGGQIFISESTLKACGSILEIVGSQEVRPKGINPPITIYEVCGIGGGFNLSLPENVPETMTDLNPGLSVRISVLDGKHAGDETYTGSIVKLSARAAVIRSEMKAERLGDLKLALIGSDGREIEGDVYVKVAESPAASSETFKVNFTSMPLDIRTFLKKTFLETV